MREGQELPMEDGSDLHRQSLVAALRKRSVSQRTGGPSGFMNFFFALNGSKDLGNFGRLNFCPIAACTAVCGDMTGECAAP
jgi:hypothetical protein